MSKRHAPHPHAEANRRGIVAMSLAMASFIANDALIKYVSRDLPAAQIIFLRGVFATVFLLAAARYTGQLGAAATRKGIGLHQLWNRPVVIRATLDAVATMVYLTSLFHMPLGNATAINMATPLFITLFAIHAYKEQVSAIRWAAIATGFLGVLLIVQPAPGAFNSWSILCLSGTILHAGRDIMTRAIPSAIPPVLVTVSTAVAVSALSGVLSMFQGWQTLPPLHVVLLAGASIFLGIGYNLLFEAMRSGEMSVVSPFRYSGLLFALLLGYGVWGDVPNILALTGILLLVGAGLYMLHHERRRKTRNP